jgi:hypothetical protein
MKYLLFLVFIVGSLYGGYRLDRLQNGDTVIIANSTCGRSAEQLKTYPQYQCTAEFKRYGKPFVVTSQYTVLTESSPSVSVKFGKEITSHSWRLFSISNLVVSFNTLSILSAAMLVAWISSEAIRKMDDPLV